MAKPVINDLLPDVTFVIPFRIEVQEQVKVMEATLNFLTCRFASRVLLLEAGPKRYFRKKIPDRRVSYSCIEDREAYFRRTQYLNVLYACVQTPILAVWEPGIIIPPEQTVDTVEQIRKKRTWIGLPHNGTICLLTPQHTDLFNKTANISVLLREKYSFPAEYGRLSTSGAFIANTEKLLTAGGENEHLTGNEIEDAERIKRMEILYSTPVYKTAGCAFRMYPHKNIRIQPEAGDKQEFLKICGMERRELKNYIKNWLPRNNAEMQSVRSKYRKNAAKEHTGIKYRLIALYLPQYHPVAENDEWWGKGYTEWTSVGKAKPLFKGHEQPRVPADLGYYDLRLPEVRVAQAELAKEAGIEGFCYWHYRFGNGKRLLDMPFREVLESGKPDFPFCLAWANESWKGFFHGVKGRNTLIEQKYSGEEDDEAHFYEVLPAFKDHRYIRVHDKPLFMIFNPFNMPNVRFFIAQWQKLAIQNGFSGLYLVGHIYNPARIDLLLKMGFDAVNIVRQSSCISGNKIKPLSIPDIPNVYRYADLWRGLLGAEEKEHNIIPTLIPNWDHSPRCGKQSLIFHQSTPQLFDKHLKQVLETIRHKPEQERIAFIKSWNEWGEGNYLEPDVTYGKSYLDVIKKRIVIQYFCLQK